MKKIPSLFMRNYDGDRFVRDEVVPGSEWVVAGEGIATRKHDGTAVMLKDGVLFKRYDAKGGKTPPSGFVPCQEPDPISGHWPGWVPLKSGPDGKPEATDRWLYEAYGNAIVEYKGSGNIPNGTYELCGPKINRNPEGLADHRLIPHGNVVLSDCPRTFDALRVYLWLAPGMEGVVWHHPDGRMVKIKRRDFQPFD